ncbi:glutathione S-transferase family protein [Tabrizicola sp.]|uniref:glutathione S-transferase family protein n=1 Tax=Tabrizicola sp. TaxID=2005166 RepID=UPI00286A989A|nr:glutathione S-transferase family protein [Tabrizicola sp.]
MTDTLTTDSMTLVSFDLCPYVQRAAIVLAEKGIPFARRDVDLANKPDWFTRISPQGKVPLLLVGDEVLFESSVIVEYIEDTTPSPLHPTAPLARARHRAWMEFGSSMLGDIWVLETTKDSTVLDQKVATLRDKFARVEAALAGGPWFAGAAFSVVDAVFAPMFRYFDVFDQITDLCILTGLPKVTAWRKALAARPSVITAVVPNYNDLLHAFLRAHEGALLARA